MTNEPSPRHCNVLQTSPGQEKFRHPTGGDNRCFDKLGEQIIASSLLLLSFMIGSDLLSGFFSLFFLSGAFGGNECNTRVARPFVLSRTDILFLKYDSSIFRQASYPVHGRAKPVLHRPNSTEPNLFHHRETTYRAGWMTVWECCRHALEKGCLLINTTPITVASAASRFRQISREEEDPTRQMAAGRTKGVERAIPYLGKRVVLFSQVHIEHSRRPIFVITVLGKKMNTMLNNCTSSLPLAPGASWRNLVQFTF